MGPIVMMTLGRLYAIFWKQSVVVERSHITFLRFSSFKTHEPLECDRNSPVKWDDAWIKRECYEGSL